MRFKHQASCAFLLAFGVLSVLHARDPSHPTTLVFSTVMALVWTFRLLLEFVYPVRLRIFVLDDPHLPDPGAQILHRVVHPTHCHVPSGVQVSNKRRARNSGPFQSPKETTSQTE